MAPNVVSAAVITCGVGELIQGDKFRGDIKITYRQPNGILDLFATGAIAVEVA